MWLPKDRHYRMIENVIVVEDREVYSHKGKLLGVLPNTQYPRSQAQIMELLQPAKEQPKVVKSEPELHEPMRRMVGRPRKEKDEQ